MRQIVEVFPFEHRSLLDWAEGPRHAPTQQQPQQGTECLAPPSSRSLSAHASDKKCEGGAHRAWAKHTLLRTALGHHCKRQTEVEAKASRRRPTCNKIYHPTTTTTTTDRSACIAKPVLQYNLHASAEHTCTAVRLPHASGSMLFSLLFTPCDIIAPRQLQSWSGQQDGLMPALPLVRPTNPTCNGTPRR